MTSAPSEAYRSRTASDGTFVVPAAPVGVYDLVAYKKGFLPALIRIWHPALSGAPSSVHIELHPKDGAGAERAPTDITSVWELRDKVPSDVLREITLEDQGGPAEAASHPPAIASVPGSVGVTDRKTRWSGRAPAPELRSTDTTCIFRCASRRLTITSRNGK